MAVYMDDDVYEGLRLKAFQDRTSMSQELIETWIKANRPWIKKAAKSGGR